MATAAPETPCPVCGGTGWKMLPPAPGESAGRAVRCGCLDVRREAGLLAAAHIPPRYQHCTLANFAPPPGARELELAHRRAEVYARDYPARLDSQQNGLLFFGGVGTGKTHLGVAILQALMERGLDCRFCDHRELLKQIQATFDPANPATEAGVVAPLLGAEVLLLDDLGVGRATEWAIETLHYILNHRYSRGRATLITTNLEDGESRLESKTPPLVQAVGERLRSRLHEMCVFVAMHGPDFRMTADKVVR